MKKGFTLIELLIVVAIIAILAAIAVPNFLEAQTRAKISRVKSDLRTFTTGIELYNVDSNYYPKGTDKQYSLAEPAVQPPERARVLERLSTPIAYLASSAIIDPFTSRVMVRPDKQNGVAASTFPIAANEVNIARYYKYTAFTPGQGSFVTALVDRDETTAKWAWAMWSPGPEGRYVQLRGSNLLASGGFGPPTKQAIVAWVYDPTNGTVSQGNIWRTGGQRTGEGMAGDIWLTTMLPLTSL